MPQTMTAHQSFRFLVDNIPSWQDTVKAISDHTAKRHAEFVADFARIVSDSRPKRRKTPSVASIHDREDDRAHPPSDLGQLDTSSSHTQSPSLPNRTEIDPFQPGNKYLYAHAIRKRKPGSSIRSGASGPQKFRNKNHVVVYYDGHVQEQLDTLVKTVGLGRANLRRGRTALAATKGFPLPVVSRTSGYQASMDDMRTTMISRSTSAPVSTKKARALIGPSTSADESTFLQLDKELESVQSMCEVAAHQFLRDGDCQIEFDHILSKLDSISSQATSTAEMLERAEQHSLDDERDSAIGSDMDSNPSLSTQPSLDFSKAPKPVLISSSAIKSRFTDMKTHPVYSSAPQPPTDKTANVLTAETIEVDDSIDQGEDDDDDLLVDITSYRMANPRRARA
jgi:hypothetical protein